MRRKQRVGVSPLLGTILLVSMVFLLGVGVSFIAGRVGGPNLKHTPNVLLQLWRNFPGRGAVGVVNVKGEEVEEAFYADFVIDTEYGSIFENVRWKNLEVKVNGQAVENELEYLLYASPLPADKKVKNALLSLPSGGGVVSFSYRQGFLKIGDEVAVVHKPSKWVLAQTTMAHPLECPEVESAWLGPNMVDSCISLRALQSRALEREMVGALFPYIENRVNENYRWYYENFGKARSYIPRIENLVGQIQLLLNSCKATGGYLENDLRELYDYMGPGLISEQEYYKLCMAYKSYDQWKRGVPQDNRLLYLLVNGLEVIYTMENPVIRAWDPSYVSKWQGTGTMYGLIENVARDYTNAQLKPIIRQIENLLDNSPYPGIPVEAITYFGVSPEMDDIYEDFYRPAIVPNLVSYKWVDSTTFEFIIKVYNVGGDNANNFTRVATLWYSLDNKWWVSKYFKRAKDEGLTPENALYVKPENWLVPMESKLIGTWGTRVFDNGYHNTYRYTSRIRLDNWWKGRPGLANKTYLENLSPELVAFNLQVPYAAEPNTNTKLASRVENRPSDRALENRNLAPGTYWYDNIRIKLSSTEMDNKIWLEDYYFIYQHPKTGQWEYQYFWNIHWAPDRIPGAGGGGGGGGGGC
jgi:hypothetical protein